ncbi:MAG: hypothetical protein QOD65_2976 [Gaiellales bacterium]|nr:hypothetical protein [Gaiellales bacterium]
MDDFSRQHDPSAEELAAVERALAALGEQPLPPGVATRLDARLAADSTSSPLATRRARRGRVRLGASLSAVAAVAAAVVFALSSSGGNHPRKPESAGTLRAAAADSAAPQTSAAKTQMKTQAPAGKCLPASRTAGDRPRPGCPGARGGHARAV